MQMEGKGKSAAGDTTNQVLTSPKGKQSGQDYGDSRMRTRKGYSGLENYRIRQDTTGQGIPNNAIAVLWLSCWLSD